MKKLVASLLSLSLILTSCGKPVTDSPTPDSEPAQAAQALVLIATPDPISTAAGVILLGIAGGIFVYQASANSNAARNNRRATPAQAESAARHNCGQSHYDNLHQRQKTFCSQDRRCTQEMSCAQLSARISAGSNCLDARQRIHRECFKGIDVPGGGHAQEIDAVRSTMLNCQNIFSMLRCR